jgi:ATP-grasp domain
LNVRAIESTPDLGQYGDLFHPWRIAWLCRAGHYSAALTPLCPIDVVACMDDSTVHDLLGQREGIRFFSIEKSRGRLEDDSAMNEVVPSVRKELLSALAAEGRGRRMLAAASPSQSLVDFASEAGCPVISNPPELAAWLNNKVHFFEALSELGLPRIPGRWVSLDRTRYSELASENGSRFVLQRARGASGSGTAFVAAEADYIAAGTRFGGVLVHAAPDLGDLSINVNALALTQETVVSSPSVQLAGLSMLHSLRGMYCGNDFIAARELPAPLVREVIEQTAQIGAWIASLGFRGLFGLDFVVDCSDSKPYAVDLNPRWQGSTTPLSMAEAKAGRLPLAVADLALRMGALDENDVFRKRDEFLQTVNASHLSLRCEASSWWEVQGELRPGVYSEDMNFERSGVRLTDMQAPNELLVTGGVPRRGARMGPKSHVLRVAAERQVLDVGRLRPLPWAEDAARSLYEALALNPIKPGD